MRFVTDSHCQQTRAMKREKSSLQLLSPLEFSGFVSITGIGWKVTKALRAPMLLLERPRTVHGSLSCSPWVLLWFRFNLA